MQNKLKGKLFLLNLDLLKSLYFKKELYLKYAKIQIFADPYSPYKDRISGSSLWGLGQWKPAFSYILCSVVDLTELLPS